MNLRPPQAHNLYVKPFGHHPLKCPSEVAVSLGRLSTTMVPPACLDQFHCSVAFVLVLRVGVTAFWEAVFPGCSTGCLIEAGDF